ncbi:MAG: hypothetical protein AVDCRST_MAG31-2445, partial [uncultured Sphingomonas sp.]
DQPRGNPARPSAGVLGRLAAARSSARQWRGCDPAPPCSDCRVCSVGSAALLWSRRLPRRAPLPHCSAPALCFSHPVRAAANSHRGRRRYPARGNASGGHRPPSGSAVRQPDLARVTSAAFPGVLPRLPAAGRFGGDHRPYAPHEWLPSCVGRGRAALGRSHRSIRRGLQRRSDAVGRAVPGQRAGAYRRAAATSLCIADRSGGSAGDLRQCPSRREPVLPRSECGRAVAAAGCARTHRDCGFRDACSCGDDAGRPAKACAM